jgi:Fur family ferric uptake transcriptional regulator
MANERLNLFAERLHQHGYRLTPARQAVIHTLLATGGHLSADTLAEAVRETAPQVGRMTVYRTLDLLSNLGLVRPVYQGTGAAHYILVDNGHHHHLVCSGCNAVIEFDECVLAEIERVVGERFQFEVWGHLVEFYGRCQQCRHL